MYSGHEHSESREEEYFPSLEKESAKTSKERKLARAKIEAMQERKRLQDMLSDIFEDDV